MTRAVLARVEPVVGPPGTLLDIHATNAPFSHLLRSWLISSRYGRPQPGDDRWQRQVRTVAQHARTASRSFILTDRSGASTVTKLVVATLLAVLVPLTPR